MRMILARHAETVFNAAARMQGQMAHTPLTRAGLAQAETMGEALAAYLGESAADIDIWASPAGRTLQTAAIVAEHLGRSYFSIRTDPRLLEIHVGAWEGRLYADVVAEVGPIICPDRRVFSVPPPGGEWFPAIAGRLQAWLSELDPRRDVLVISHGVTLRVLRGLLTGAEPYTGVPLADDAPQGTVFAIEGGVQSVLHVGAGAAGHRAL